MVTAGLLAAAACSNDGDKKDCKGGSCDERNVVVQPDQGEGWEIFRDLYHFTHQGSRLIPNCWLVALEQADSDAMFAEPANMKRLGFNEDLVRTAQAERLNPDNLPLGVVKDDRAGRFGEEWVGSTALLATPRKSTTRAQLFRSMEAVVC